MIGRGSARATGAAAAVILGLGLWATGPASASTGWVIQKTPKQPYSASLLGVSCVTGGTCTAVGYYDASSVGSTGRRAFAFAEQRVNGRWAVQSVGPVQPGDASFLNGVSCTSAAYCVAVGYTVESTTSGAQPMAQLWNGTDWTLLTVPLPSSAETGLLYGVSCTSAIFCLAVGESSTSIYFPGQTLVESWNGSAWTVVPTGDGVSGGAFYGVSCPTSTACVAAGVNDKAPLAEIWQSGTWTAEPVPVPAGASMSQLNAVSCSAIAACTAVGYGYSSATQTTGLIDRWNGTRWAQQSAPPSSSLEGVACPGADSCTAVGMQGQVPGAPVAERWSRAGGWTAEATEAPAKATWSQLNALSCASRTRCIATGYYDTGKVALTGHVLAESN